MDFVDNRVRIDQSFTPLLAGAVFQSKSQICDTYRTIRGMAFSDVASATNGLLIEQSLDGLDGNWDVSDAFSLSAGVAKTFDVSLFGNFVRFSLTNDVGAQTVLRIAASIVI